MEDKRAHLEMIQAVISRMASNSFMLKGWSVILVSALFALSAVEANPTFALLAFFPSIAFWALDGYFLRQERLFRKLYDHVRSTQESATDFSMNTKSFENQVATWGHVMWSTTLRIFHGAIMVSILAVTLINCI